MGFSIGEDSLDDVQAILGRSHVTKGADRHDPNTICYTFDDDYGSCVISFFAGWSGSWETLTGFELILGENGNSPAIEESTLIPTTSGGLCLGMTNAEVVDMFGQPSEIEGDTYIYKLSFEKKMSEDKVWSRHVHKYIDQGVDPDDLYFFIYNYVEIEFKEGHSVRFMVHRSESS